MSAGVVNRVRRYAIMLEIEYERIGTPEANPAEVARLLECIMRDSQALTILTTTHRPQEMT